jgi:hypothetical protein
MRSMAYDESGAKRDRRAIGGDRVVVRFEGGVAGTDLKVEKTAVGPLHARRRKVTQGLGVIRRLHSEADFEEVIMQEDIVGVAIDGCPEKIPAG